VILRIAREQMEARGGLGAYPVFAAISGFAFVVTVVVSPFLPHDTRMSLIKTQVALGAITVALIGGIFATNGDRKRALAQEKAICDASLETLVRITSNPAFKLKELDFTQALTVKELVKKSSPSAPREAISKIFIETA
jgi:hypothetical protein